MRLFWKLFLLQLLAASAVVAGVLMLSRNLSVRGFAEFLEARERERMEQLAEQLGTAVGKGEDLTQAWDEFAQRRRFEKKLHLPPPEHESDSELEGGERVVVRRHISRPPLQLQDAEGHFLRGARELPEGVLREPIEVGERTIGYIVWPRAPRHPEQIQFAHQQLMHVWRIAPVALAIAAAFALLITGLIVRPIRQLSSGAAALTRREFATRLPENRRDELGTLAADFNRLARSLEGYDGRQRQWLADISHELRTPVAVLRGELEALLDGLRPADGGAIRSLRQEVGRLETLIGDLQLVSLAESGGLRLNLTQNDLAALAQQSAERFRERLKARGFELKVDAAPGLTANVDAQRIEQVLANLIENALRHASAPGPVVVTARADGTQAVLTVADGGPGVPAEALPRLFDRLYRVEAARARASGGAGLGLSICKSIVEAHGGTIAAQLSAAGGLEIVIRLPRFVGAAHGRDS